MTDPLTDVSNQSPWAIATRWLLGQPFNNVLTFLLLIAIGYGTYLGAPQIIEEVRRQRTEFTEALRDQRVEFLSGIKQTRDDCSRERALEREHAKELLERAVRAVQLNRPLDPIQAINPPATAKGGNP